MRWILAIDTGYLKVLILLRLLLRFKWLKTLATLWRSLVAFWINVLFSLKMNSKQFCSFDNFISLLWGSYSFGFWSVLALKLTIRIKESRDMVRKGWKSFPKLRMLSLWYVMVLKCFVIFSFTSNFHQIYFNLYATLFMA